MKSSMTFDHYDDFDAQAERLAGFDQHYQQLDAGAYAGAFLTCEAPGVSVAVEWTNRTLYQQGSGADGVISAVILLAEGRHRESSVNGVPLTTDHVLLLGEGAPYDARVEAGAIPAVVSVPASNGPLSEAMTGTANCLHRPELARQLRTVAESTVRGEATAATALSSAAMLAYGLSSSPGGRGEINIFREACALLVGNDQLAQMPVASVARTVGVSRRTLDDLFNAHVGIAPARFRKVFRLNKARRLIETGDYSVTSAANLSGLHHLGRFSQEYNALFGELPSTTRRRLQLGGDGAPP